MNSEGHRIYLATALLLAATPPAVAAPNLLANPSFEVPGPDGPSTVNTTAVPGGAGASAADSWGVFNNTAGSGSTELLTTTRPGGTGRMIRVTMDGAGNGLAQMWAPFGTGPAQAYVSAWVLVESGVVGIGAGNGGSTTIGPTTTLVDEWEYVTGLNFPSPVNEMIVYSDTVGGNTFFVDDAAVVPVQAPVRLDTEYSNRQDERAIPGGDAHSASDPGQVLYTEPRDVPGNGYPIDIFDFYPAIEEPEPDGEVDALANAQDALFLEVVGNAVPLVFSLEGDEAPADRAVFAEDVTGDPYEVFGHPDFAAAADGGDAGVEDVDGLEFYGPVAGSDANFYSLEADALTGVSVWTTVPGTPTPYLAHGDLVVALTSLGWEGDPNDVDIDALMVADVNGDGEWTPGDRVLFSIRPAGAFDGGEVIRWRAGAPPTFLDHGGHLWDTAFPVAARFETRSENVDALEAAPLYLLFPEPPAASVPTLPIGAMAILLGALAATGARLRAAAGTTGAGRVRRGRRPGA
jgi:hypothetical protein